MDLKKIPFWLKILLICGITLAGLLFAAALYYFDPSTSGVFPPCPTNYFTDLHCTGCGTLRCLHALLHLDIEGALSQNALTVFFVPIVPLMFIFPEKFTGRGFSLGVLIVFIIFTVLRNIDCYPFTLLAPH